MRSIHNTSVVPYLIAEQVAGAENEIAVTYLVKKSERIYESSLHFRTLINDAKRDCRETLAIFMNHWLMAANFKTTKS